MYKNMLHTLQRYMLLDTDPLPSKITRIPVRRLGNSKGFIVHVERRHA